MSSRNPEPVVAELADQIPLLKQHDGTVMWFAGLGSESMRPHRIQLAEAIITWLRDNGHMPKSKAAKTTRNRPAGGSGQAKARS